MHFLTFHPKYVPKLCLNFNNFQSIYAYKDYVCKKKTVTICTKEKEKIIFKGLKLRSY